MFVELDPHQQRLFEGLHSLEILMDELKKNSYERLINESTSPDIMKMCVGAINVLVDLKKTLHIGYGQIRRGDTLTFVRGEDEEPINTLASLSL